MATPDQQAADRTSPTPRSLADEITQGQYTPHLIDRCSPLLPTDRTPHVIRFREFTLLSEANRRDLREPRYLALQSHRLLPVAEQRVLQHTIESAITRAVKGDKNPLGGRFHSFVKTLAGDIDLGVVTGNRNRLVSALAGALIPGEFQTFKSVHPLVAICTTLEQVWELTGYTCGERLASASLGPGERRTLEVHTWDKSTRKTEEELATELDIRSSEKITQRDALTVAQEFARQRSSKVDANGTIPIPKMPVGVSANLANETRNSLRRARDTTQEQTVESSNTLRVNRKTRIELSREIGHEEKQTSIVENTNRCHTLNFHYYEVIANYLVSTRVARIELALLLPTSRASFTVDWVLCHEGILKQALLDKTVLPGFPAAKILKTQDYLAAMEARVRLAQLEELGEQVRPHVTTVLTAYNNLTAARDIVAHAATACQNVKLTTYGVLQYYVCFTTKSSEVDLIRAAAFLSLPDVARQALDALKADVAAGRNYGEALKSFLTSVSPDIFMQVVSPLEREQRLLNIGIPPLVVSGLLKKDPLKLDDAGLRAAVNAAAASATRVSEASSSTQVESISNRELAEARVEFERLSCHLEDNWMHYNQTAWCREAHDQRFARLLNEHGVIATLIENDLLGFYGDRAAYPLRTPLEVLDPNIGRIVDELREVQNDGSTPADLVPMPTPGLILEATLGECDVCEAYIHDSRLIELRQQRAKARQEEAEADRQEQRLIANPPDLSDPKAQNASQLSVTLRSDSNS